MVSRRIFDLQDGQGHEHQHRRVRRWLAFAVAYKKVEKMVDLSQAVLN